MQGRVDSFPPHPPLIPTRHSKPISKEKLRHLNVQDTVKLVAKQPLARQGKADEHFALRLGWHANTQIELLRHDETVLRCCMLLITDQHKMTDNAM